MSDGQQVAAQYDAMAAAYAAEQGAYNSFYERPAMLRLLGDVAGLDVLDAGCGAGPLTLELCQAGASVVGLDVSPAMVAIARERLGARATFHVADLSHALPLDDSSCHLVVSSLALHYLEHWTPTLKEFRRVLRPGGQIVLSTHHPTMDWKRLRPDDYFAKVQITETWERDGTPFDVTFWRRPLQTMSAEIEAAGLVIKRIDEPMPTTAMAGADPESDAYLRTNPHFLFLTLVPS